MTRMNERTINALFGIVSEPEQNVYDTSIKRNLEEIKRIVRVFDITNQQKDMAGVISARGLVAFKMLVSNN